MKQTSFSGRELGIVSDERNERFRTISNSINEVIDLLKNFVLSPQVRGWLVEQ